MAEMNSTKAQARYKKAFDKHARLDPRFEAGIYVFLARPPLLASAADRTTVVIF